MKYLYQLCIISLCLLFSCCGNPSRESIDNESEEIARNTIDSLISLEPELSIKSISFEKIKVPALFSESLSKDINESIEAAILYVFGKGMAGTDLDNPKEWKEVEEQMLVILTPLRNKVKETDKQDSPKYICSLVSLINNTDSNKNEKRIYFLNKDNPSIVERSEKFSKTSQDNFKDILLLVYAPEGNFNMTRKELPTLDEIKSNPVYNFLANE